MEKTSDFDRNYFIQTRKEIDTIRVEINRYLYFALFVLGASGLNVTRFIPNLNDGDVSFSILLIGVAALFVNTTLFYVRRLQLQQIADRWFALYAILTRIDEPDVLIKRLENLVCVRFAYKSHNTYLRQEFILNLALSLPIYCSLFLSAFHAGINIDEKIRIPLLIVIVHIFISYLLLSGNNKLKDKINFRNQNYIEPSSN